MNGLRVGFSRVNIDPPLGIPIRGYFVPRYASGILDSLHINMLAFSYGKPGVKKGLRYDPPTGSYRETEAEDTSGLILMACIDNCGLSTSECTRLRAAIEEATGVPADRIYLHCDHTHTAPYTEPKNAEDPYAEIIREYEQFLKRRIVLAASEAIRDLAPARMGFGTVKAPDRIAYIRRYRMKDGTTWTCPPVNDPNIAGPIGTLDQRVHIVRFDREGKDSLVVVNYGLHADTLNLDLISADWPGALAKTFETAVPDAKIISFVGAEGDVGSTNVHPMPGDMNDTDISFDNEMKSAGMCRFVGRALAGSVLQIYDKVEYTEADGIGTAKKVIRVAANVPAKEEMERAHLYKKLHDEGRDQEIPYTAMELTTVVAEASRMCALEHGPEFFEFTLTGVRIGPVAFVGIPAEPFTEIGRQIKENEGWKLICPTANTNGKEGYFPMKDAFDEGGYEARSSRFKAGVAETVIGGAAELLKELRKKG